MIESSPGAGKTTLVRQITTELLPTSGAIHVFGHDVVTEPNVVKGLMGIVPQEAQLFEELTVHQVFRIFGKLRGHSTSGARRRADELISDLHLDEHRDVTTLRLSGGLRRRVFIGIAALANPRLMVLDEPTTGLDPQSRRDVWSLLRQYQERGATILLTTHYMDEAEALCDRVGIIQRGQLVTMDTIPNLRAVYGHDFKITFSSNGDRSAVQTLSGRDDQELVDRVQALGVRQFSVAKTTLEDINLALTDGKETLNGNTS